MTLTDWAKAFHLWIVVGKHMGSWSQWWQKFQQSNGVGLLTLGMCDR